MAIERPPLDSFITASRPNSGSSRPSLDSFVISDQKQPLKASKTQENASKFGSSALDRQEERIASHHDLLKESFTEKQDPITSALNPAKSKLIRGVAQRATSAVVNPLIAAQRDPWALVDPRKYGTEVLKGLTGERRSEVGDLYTGAGAGEKSAAALGLGTELALTAPEQIINAPRNIQRFGQGVGRYLEGRGAAKAAKKFGEMKKDIQFGKSLSDDLYKGAQEAKKSAGAKQGNYIDANATQLKSEAEMNRIISQLPESIQAEIKANPAVAKDIIQREESRQFVIKKGSDSKLTKPKIVNKSPDSAGKKAIIRETEIKGSPDDIYGRALTETVSDEPKIAANLKNLETIRGIIRGDVPASKFNPKMLNMDEQNIAKIAYDEVGKLMRDGNPELQKHMQNYAEIMNALKKVAPQVRDRLGFTRTKPLIKMLDKVKEGGDVSVQQAIVRLAEENPNIIPSVEKIRKFGEGVKRTKYYKQTAKKAAELGAAGAGFGGIARILT